MLFEWDEEKAKKNFHDHGVSFDVAKLVFNDPYHIELYDEEHSINEDRYIAIGYVENMKQKIEDMKELGYSQEEIIKMTKSFPAIYNCSIENIKQKIEDMIVLGYNKEEVIRLISARVLTPQERRDYYDD